MLGSNLWLKIWIWTKLVITALLVLYVLVFVIVNSDHRAQFWYWPGHEPETSILVLVFFSFGGGAAVALLLRTIIKTLRQIRGARERSRTVRLERDIEQMKAKASMLQTRPASADPTLAPPEE
jgi:uncharacterized integral membrane protein